MSEIVIVEDERNLRELFLDLLGAQGHQVVAFDRLAPAEAHLAKNLPDLLLLDVKLPDGDGQQLLERLRDAPARCPTIVMTAFGTVERAVAALRAGARDFLVKPFENARLLSAVAAALESGISSRKSSSARAR